MDKIIEIPVGGTFRLRNRKQYVCLEDTERQDCEGCAFYDESGVCEMPFICPADYRHDGKDVLYKQLKGGKYDAD